jgi:tripartite-type tricarboxylate transporter receptor subunit TctC
MMPAHVVASALIGSALICSGGVSAQDYPSKPIRIITTAAGGGGDFSARQIAQGISGPLGHPVIVDNRTGASAAEAVAKAPADGYTLLNASGAVWSTPLMRPTPYDVARDFAPLSMLVREVSIIAVHPSLPVKSVKDLISLAKARPGVLNYSSALPGATSHLQTELFKSMAGVDIVGIYYKATAQATAALIGGETQMAILNVDLILPHMKSGRLRALAVTSAQPSTLAPGLPTVADTGLPRYEAVSMTGMFVPAKTPQAIVDRLSREVMTLMSRAEVKERFLNTGVEPVGSSPEQFGAAVKADIANLSKVIKEANIKIE